MKNLVSFALSWAVNAAVIALLTGCASTALPAEKCTPTLQASYLARCKLDVATACEFDSQACLLPADEICADLVATICPASR